MRRLLLLHYLNAHGHPGLLAEHIYFYYTGPLMAVYLTDLALEAFKGTLGYVDLLAFYIAVGHLYDVVRSSKVKE